MIIHDKFFSRIFRNFLEFLLQHISSSIRLSIFILKIDKNDGVNGESLERWSLLDATGYILANVQPKERTEEGRDEEIW